MSIEEKRKAKFDRTRCTVKHCIIIGKTVNDNVRAFKTFSKISLKTPWRVNKENCKRKWTSLWCAIGIFILGFVIRWLYLFLCSLISHDQMRVWRNCLWSSQIYRHFNVAISKSRGSPTYRKTRRISPEMRTWNNKKQTSQLVFTQFHVLTTLPFYIIVIRNKFVILQLKKQKIITFTLLLLVVVVDFHTQRKTNSLIQSQALTSQTHTGEGQQGYNEGSWFRNSKRRSLLWTGKKELFNAPSCSVLTCCFKKIIIWMK